MAAFSGAYAGALRCFPQADGTYWFRSTGSFERMANDLLESRTDAPAGSPVGALLALLFAADEDLPPALRECTQRTRASAPELRPRLTDAAIDEIAELVGGGRSVFPADWISPLGTGVQLAQTLRNLTMAAVAHVAAVSCASTDQPGMGVKWLLGEATENWLVRLMSSRGGVDREAARQMLDLLIYGNHLRTADPALQFLFPLRDGLIAVPWFLYATCNSERNLLTLLARARPSEFDNASHAFERAMIRELREAVTKTSWKARFNRVLPGEDGAGEVDAVLLDPIGRIAIVCELRWFLEPSEVREVAAREAEGPRKVKQAETKMAALSRVIDIVLHEENIAIEGEWTIDGVAVFDNHTPVPSDAGKVPVVSHRAFLATIKRHPRLRDLAAALRNGDWLPRRDEHFTIDPTQMEIAGLRITVDGINPTHDGYRFVLERDGM